MPLRLLVVDDHPLVVDGLRSSLRLADAVVVASASGLAAARAILEEEPIDVAIVDIGLSDGSGLDLLPDLTRLGVPAIVFTGHADSSLAADIIARGAAAFVDKGSQTKDLLRAVQAAASRPQRAAPRVTGTRRARLSPREADVLRRIAQGESNKAIAAELGLGLRTVETYRERLMSKLDAHNAADITRAALNLGLLSKKDPPG